MNNFQEHEDDEMSMRAVVTCGLCETICETENFTEHECLQGYAHYYMNENNLYFYPMCEDGSILRRSLVDDQEITVQEPQTSSIMATKRKNIRKKLSTLEKQNMLELEEQLILEVQAREALWNPQVPLLRRSRKAVSQLWKEVSDALNGKLSETEAKTKFKALHDTYRRIISSESLASGSERPVKKSKWQHYDNLSFLRDSCLQKPTKSNVSCTDGDDEDSAVSISEDMGQNIQQKHNRKQNTNKKDFNSALDRIADAFCERNTPITLPSPPQNDDVDAIVMVVERRLRKLPQHMLDDAAQKIFQVTYDLVKETETD